MEPAKRPLFPIYDILEHWQAHAFTTPEVRPVHHALYHALVYMCKRRGGAHRFNLPTQEGMQACGIAARNTYTAALRDLEGWGFVVYTPGANGIIAPIVDVKFCASTEQALSSYRSSLYAAGDASTEHIIKEVKRLKEEDEKRASSLAEKEKEIQALKAQLQLLQAQTPPAPQAVPPTPEKVAALATTDPIDEQRWDEGPLTKPEPFRIICDRLGYEGIAYEKYRKQALVSAQDGNISRTILQWTSWIRNYLRNQERNGPLLKQSADLPTEPTPTNQLPQPGQEKKGQVIAIQGVSHDESLNRMKVAAYQKNYPTAIIHAIR
jgi:hypothetical protein